MLILHSANKNNYTKLQVKILHSIVRLSTRRSMEGPKKLQNVILKNFRRQNRKKKLLFQKLLSKKFFFYYWYPIRYTNMLLTEHQVTLECGLKKVFEEVSGSFLAPNDLYFRTWRCKKRVAWTCYKYNRHDFTLFIKSISIRSYCPTNWKNPQICISGLTFKDLEIFLYLEF